MAVASFTAVIFLVSEIDLVRIWNRQQLLHVYGSSIAPQPSDDRFLPRTSDSSFNAFYFVFSLSPIGSESCNLESSIACTHAGGCSSGLTWRTLHGQMENPVDLISCLDTKSKLFLSRVVQDCRCRNCDRARAECNHAITQSLFDHKDLALILQKSRARWRTIESGIRIAFRRKPYAAAWLEARTQVWASSTKAQNWSSPSSGPLPIPMPTPATC